MFIIMEMEKPDLKIATDTSRKSRVQKPKTKRG